MSTPLPLHLASAFASAEALYNPQMGSNNTVKNVRAVLAHLSEQAYSFELYSAHHCLPHTNQEQYLLSVDGHTLEVTVSAQAALYPYINQVRTPQSFAAYQRILARATTHFIDPQLSWLESFFLSVFRRNTPSCSFQLEFIGDALLLSMHDAAHRTVVHITFLPREAA